MKNVETEASLARVWKHLNDPEKVVALISAFQGDPGVNVEMNLSNNRALAADIHNFGQGYMFLDGYWIVDREKVEETAIFVAQKIKHEHTERLFVEKMTSLANQSNQDAVLIKTSEGMFFYYGDGRKEAVGDLRAGKLGTAYTRLRTNKKTNTFVFEVERDELNIMSKIANATKEKRKAQG